MKNRKLFILFILICLLSISSCNKREKYLKKAIKYDAIVCVLIYAEGSAIIMAENSSDSFIREIGNDSSVIDPEKYLFESIANGTAIRVSNKFYNDKYSYKQIIADAEMDSIYSKEGVKGLVKKYFKKEENQYILWNSTEQFPVGGTSSYPAYGEDHNVGYMAYLLSKHQIYLCSVWVCEGGIDYIDIFEDISDMKQLDGL